MCAHDREIGRRAENTAHRPTDNESVAAAYDVLWYNPIRMTENAAKQSNGKYASEDGGIAQPRGIQMSADYNT